MECKSLHLTTYIPWYAWPRYRSFAATNLLRIFPRQKTFSRKFLKEDSITHTSKNHAATSVGGHDVDSNGDRESAVPRYAGELRITDRTLRGRVGYLRSLDLVRGRT